MKLTPAQLEYIQEALLNVNAIKYQDFYEEIYDHFIVSIETSMADGQAFDVAFDRVYGAFLPVEHDYLGRNPFGKVMEVTTYYGLPALEIQYLETLQEQVQKRFFYFIKRLFGWPRLLGTVLIALLCYLLADRLMAFNGSYTYFLSLLLGFLPLLLSGVIAVGGWVKYLLGRARRAISAKAVAIERGPYFFLFVIQLVVVSPAGMFSQVFLEQPIWTLVPVAGWACLYFGQVVAIIAFYQLYRSLFHIGSTAFQGRTTAN